MVTRTLLADSMSIIYDENRVKIWCIFRVGIVCRSGFGIGRQLSTLVAGWYWAIVELLSTLSNRKRVHWFLISFS